MLLSVAFVVLCITAITLWAESRTYTPWPSDQPEDDTL